MKLIRRSWIDVTMSLGAVLAVCMCIHVLLAKTSEAQLSKEMLPPGWQFYSNPTALEQPGTVFRIDRSGHRYIVKVLAVATMTGREAVGKSDKTIETDVNALARIWNIVGKLKGSASGNFRAKVKFSMIGTEREVTTDFAIEEVLRSFTKKVAYKKDNRYFVIRESMSATEIDYELSNNFLAQLGGEGTFKAMFSGQGSVSFRKGNEYILEQKFPSRMRVLFLAEEIVPAEKSLSDEAPTFEYQPVKEILKWED